MGIYVELYIQYMLSSWTVCYNSMYYCTDTIIIATEQSSKLPTLPGIFTGTLHLDLGQEYSLERRQIS